MRRFTLSLAVLLVAGILPATRAVLFAADATKVADKTAPAKCQSQITRLIDQLGSDRFKDREQAAFELSKLGKSALPGLKNAKESADPEVRRRAQLLVEQIKPASRSKDSQPEQRIRVKSFL